MASLVLTKILRMVDDEDLQLRASALKVLSSLKLKEPQVGKAFNKALGDTDESIRSLALDCLILNKSFLTVESLFPVFKWDGQVDLKIKDQLISLGSKTVTYIKKEYKRMSLQERLQAIELLSEIGGMPAIDFLLKQLPEVGFEEKRVLCQALRNPFNELGSKERLSILERIEKYIKDSQTSKVSKQQNTKESARTEGVVSGIILLGYLASPKALKTLVSYLQREYPFHLRKRVLVSLSRIPWKTGTDTKLLSKWLVPLLDDRDFPGVVRPVLEILEKLTFPIETLQEFKEKVEKTKHISVRKFFVKRLGALAGSDTLELLIKYSSNPDPDMRQMAFEGLTRHPDAPDALMTELESLEDEQRINDILKVLKQRNDYFTKKKLDIIFQALEKAAGKDRELAFALSILLKEVNPDYFYKTAFKKVLEAKSVKRWNLASQYLDMLATGEFFTPEVLYEMAAVLLKLSRQLPDAASRREDVALQCFANLIQENGGELLKLVQEDKALSLKDRSYLATHFQEEKDELQKFGIELAKFLPQKKTPARAKQSRQKTKKVVGKKAPVRPLTMAKSR